jgi:hypothetical protein
MRFSFLSARRPQAMGFASAELDFSAIADSVDPLALALDFCRTRKEALDETESK